MLFLAQGFGQKTSAARDTTRAEKSAADTSEVLKVVLGRDRIIIEDDDEAIQVQVGNRKLTILESLEKGESRIRMEKDEDYTEIDEPEEYLHHDWEDPEDERAESRLEAAGTSEIIASEEVSEIKINDSDIIKEDEVTEQTDIRKEISD